MKQLVIGLKGPEGAGKSTVAKMIHNRYGGDIIPFAAPLKNMLEALGVPAINLYGSPEDKLKPLPILCGKSARVGLQTLGTEWGRDLIGDTIWTTAWLHTAARSKAPVIVADDARFESEVNAIRSLGGVIIEVAPEKENRDEALHRSQHYWKLPTDYRIENPGRSLECLCASVDSAMNYLTKLALAEAS